MNPKVAELDPAYVKRERRREIRFWTSLVIAIVAIGGATWAVVVNGEQSGEITEVRTKVEHSACQVHPAGKECQRTKAESSKAANLKVTCISFHKAGYPCPKPGSAVAERTEGGGAIQQPSHTAPQPPSPSGGSPGGSTHPPVPSPTEYPPTPNPPSASPQPAPAPSTSPVQEVAEGVEETAKETVCHLGVAGVTVCP